MKVLKIIKNAVVVVVLLLGIVFATYRYTMLHMSISVNGNTSYATVYGQTDYYTIDD